MSTPTINDFVRIKSQIINTQIIADKVVEITLEAPKNKNYLPGQFVGIQINDGQKDLWFRSYSVLSDSKDNLQICVKKVKDGRGSSFLHTVKKGDFLNILFPLGYFGYPKDLAKSLVFIATGTGIVPILSLAENIPQKFQGKSQLFFGVRNEKDIIYANRIKKIENKVPSFTSTVTLSKPDKTWEGEKGRVTAILKKKKFDANSQFFICGNSAMIKSVRDLLKEKKVKDKNIFYEDFN